MRLVAIDGTTENVAYFGRHHADRGAAAFPQFQCVYLCECGTHVISDAVFWPCHTAEHKGARRWLRSVTEDMLADALADFQLIHPDHHPHLWSRLLADILHFQLPPRDHRINPREVNLTKHLVLLTGIVQVASVSYDRSPVPT